MQNDSTINLRLTRELAQQISAVAVRWGISRSELVRRALADYLARQPINPEVSS